MDASQILDGAKDELSRGNAPLAYALFKRAARSQTDYAFCTKAARFGKKLFAISGELELKTLKLALLSSTTTTFLEPLIKHFGMVFGFNFELRSGEFGGWKREIIDENSWLYEFKPDFVFINTHFRDFPLKAFCENPDEEIQGAVKTMEGLWNALSQRLPSKIIQNAIDLPSIESGGYASLASSNGRANVLRKMSELLAKKASENRVQILDLPNLQIKSRAAWEDMRTWYHGRQHPSLEALPLLAFECAKIVSICAGGAKKIIACDLDNTLWGGVIGEDGIGGIKLGAPDPEGEAFCDFQKYLLELKERGVLLAAVSKNNPEDAALPFEKHPSMKLKLDDFVSFKANWERKSENIRRIAEEISLGLDSFVFIDDNPIEIEEVSRALPMVECVLTPKDPALIAQTLDAADFFGALGVYESDIKRHGEYRANTKRAGASKGGAAASVGDFLKDFGMFCKTMDVSGNLDRCAQLINKTNQFNLTTRRYSDVEVRAISENPENCALCFDLSDKFGDSGIVGILIAKKIPAENSWEIDTMLMSCRVLGRGLEFFMINTLFERAESSGVEKIFSKYLKTAKNSQVENFYEKCGFEKIGKSDGVSKSYFKEVRSFEKIKNFIESKI